MIDSTTAAVYIPAIANTPKPAGMHPLEMQLADLPEIYTRDLLKLRLQFVVRNKLSRKSVWCYKFLSNIIVTEHKVRSWDNSNILRVSYYGVITDVII